MSATAKLCMRCKQKDITEFSTCRFCSTPFKISEETHARNIATVKSTDWKIVVICFFWLIPVVWQFLSTRPWLANSSTTGYIQSIETLTPLRSYRYTRRGSFVDMVIVKFQYTTKNGSSYERTMSTPFLPIKALPVEWFGMQSSKSISVFYDANNPGNCVSPQLGEQFSLLLLAEYGMSIFLIGLIMTVMEGMSALNTQDNTPFIKRFSSVITAAALFVILFLVPVTLQLFSALRAGP